MNDTTVHLVGSWAPLLSGGLKSCYSADDVTCAGGVSAVGALLRHYAGDDASLWIQLIDKQSSFVHMHPLGWAVNRLVLEELLGLDVVVSSPSILLQNKLDSNVAFYDISDLQSASAPLLLTNVGVPPQNSWHHFVRSVHFDKETSLAVLSVSNSGEPLTVDQIASAHGALQYIDRINRESGCLPDTSPYDAYLRLHNLTSALPLQTQRCWVPVVYYSDVNLKFPLFLAAMTDPTNPFRPALLIDVEGHDERYGEPTLVGDVWVLSYAMDTRTYFHHRLTLNETRITAVDFFTEDLSVIPDAYKDETYAENILALRALADEAQQNNPVVGYSMAMPFARDDSSYRPCKAGECAMGDLFAESLLWYTNADVAFLTSGGVRGLGWPAGEVRVENIWEALPFSNRVCTGTMSGISLFNVFNYSTAYATFQGEDTEFGGMLLQVAGLRVTYNTELQGSRLVALDIYNKTSGEYDPIERLALYNFATDSYLCGGYMDFPYLLGEALVIQGESPAVVGDTLHQNVVGEYLGLFNADEPYNTSVTGRLRNDTSVMEPLDLVQTPESCTKGTYWAEPILTCMPCPAEVDVAFTEKEIAFDGASGSPEAILGQMILINREESTVSVVPKSVPSWVRFTNDGSLIFQEGATTTLEAGAAAVVTFVADPATLDPGTARATVSFGVLNGGSYPGCIGQDATFDVLMRVSPRPTENVLGPINGAGYALMAIVVLSCLFFAGWVYWYRQLRIVRTMQPTFLITLCLGILIMSLAIVPMGVDDGSASVRGCNIACMATPWLLSLGFTVTMSALFSKLWRINTLFSQTFRRIRVREQDVVAPFAVLFTLNFALLLTWTLVDPLLWQRLPVASDQPWNTYGTCLATRGKVATAMLASVAVINAGALILASYQAYKARNIPDDFSESKYVFMALYSWLQLMVVGIPVLFLIDHDNPTAKYFLQIVLVFAVCMSMLLIIFIPIVAQVQQARRKSEQSNVFRSTRSKPSLGQGGIFVSGVTLNKSDRTAVRDMEEAAAADLFASTANQKGSEEETMPTSLEFVSMEEPKHSDAPVEDTSEESARCASVAAMEAISEDEEDSVVADT